MDQNQNQAIYTNIGLKRFGHEIPRANSYPYRPPQVGHQIKPRKLVPRLIFWPVFLLSFFGSMALGFIHFDRQVWHQDVADILPIETSFLAALPLYSSNSEVQDFNSVASLIPGGQSVYWQNIEKNLLPPLAVTSFINDARTSGAFGETYYLAGAGSERAAIFSVENKRRLADSQSRSATKSYRGEVIYELQNSDDVPKVYAWLSGDHVFISASDRFIKKMVDTQLAHAKSLKENWGKPRTELALADNDRFQQSFARLKDQSLARFYVDMSGEVEQVFKPLDVSSMPILKILGVSKLDLINTSAGSSSSDITALAIAMYSSKESINLQLVKVHKNNIDSEYNSKTVIAKDLPAKIGGTTPDFYIQYNDAGRRLSDAQAELSLSQNKDSSFLGTLKSRYGLELKDNVSDALSGRVAFVGGINQSGEAYLVIVADYNNKDLAKDFSNAIEAAMRHIAKEPLSSITDKYIVVGTGAREVNEIVDSLKKGDGQKLTRDLVLPADLGTASDYSFNTEGMVRLLNRFLSSSDQNNGSSSEVWTAINTIAKSTPYVLLSSSNDNNVSDTSVRISVQKVSVAEKNQAEKILDRLNDDGSRSVTSAAARDSARLADLVILKAALESFQKAQGRAPRELAELVPDYIQSVPRDPEGREVYSYSNKSADRSFFISLNFETTTSLGTPGVYCTTTQGTKPISGSNCKEE